jgi:hypothetical protein
MKYTAKQKTAIRRHYPHYRLKFRADGSVEAQQRPGSPYGLLYTPQQATAHLRAAGLASTSHAN